MYSIQSIYLFYSIGQVAGVASGGYSGAEVIADIITLTTGKELPSYAVTGLFALVSSQVYSVVYSIDIIDR